MSPDRRPCPGCQRMLAEKTEAKYRYPGTYTEGGDYAKADDRDLTLGFFRCGACIGKDTRAWRELGRPAATRRPPTGDLVFTDEDDGEIWP